MSEEKLRLHITPFSQDLAQFLLSTYPSIATDSISYHYLETFPEHSYGYVELSAMEGDSLKKKLNGSILKGKKLRIEQARPEKRGFEPEKHTGDSGSPAEEESRPPKRTRQRGSQIQGHQLTPERKIKRGWTEPEKANRLSAPNLRASRPVVSKYTDKPECLFRVQTPPNLEKDGSGLLRDEKKRRENGKKVMTVHEFENSVMQPSFIRGKTRTGNVGVAAEYVEGKGWIDKDGNVVEEESKTQPPHRCRTDETKRRRLPKSGNLSIHPPSSGQLRSHSSVDGEHALHKDPSRITSGTGASKSNGEAALEAADEETSSSGTTLSGSESLSESKEELEQISEAEPAGAKNASEGTPTASPSVHPLQELFKRPSQAASQTKGKRPLEIKTTFNFFGPDEEQASPQTPFTTRDLQLRGLRSAAPTPDTALPTQRFFAESVSPSIDSGFDAEAHEGGQLGPTSPLEESKPKMEPNGESEFAKWFWEHRGENNRAWKRRRRDALKEKRQRENRQKGRRIG